MQLNPNQLEQQHVHQVYDLIASHFSQTRHKAWPVVEAFLLDQSCGALGADVGCGNGKYLGVNPNIVMLGSDMSSNLVGICRAKGFDAMICDNLDLCYRPNAFDFVISIAVIHHFSTAERRLEAIRAMTRILRPNGRILVFVWALQQTGRTSRRKFQEQDVFVPWKMPQSNSTNQPVIYQRYYHLFTEGELNELVLQLDDMSIVSSGYDEGNYYVVAERRAT